MTLPELAVEIKPLGSRVVVMPLAKELVSASGIIIPETAHKDLPQEGIVIALGEGGLNDQDAVDPREYLTLGQEVIFGKYAGDDVKLRAKDGKLVDAKIIRLEGILGIVKK